MTQRRPGRPRLGEPTQAVSTRLTARDHDRLIALANRREESVARTVATLIKRALMDESGGSPFGNR